MKRALHITNAALAAIGLTTLLACGGSSGGGGSHAATLTYTDPVSGDYMLVKNASSTATHLVLDLVGPDSTISGVGFFLDADSTKVSWAAVSGANKVVSSTFTSPILACKTTGGELQGGVYQKGTAAAVTTDPTTVLAQVALDLNANVPSNTAVTFSAASGKCVVLNAPGSSTVTTPIAISVGTLVAE